MIKVGQIVKLKNPKKREEKRRWRVLRFETPTATTAVVIKPFFEGAESTTESPMHFTSTSGTSVILRRLDTAAHRLERNSESNLAPVSFWERITKRH